MREYYWTFIINLWARVGNGVHLWVGLRNIQRTLTVYFVTRLRSTAPLLLIGPVSVPQVSSHQASTLVDIAWGLISL
jgi:hypothetical protein